MEKINAVLDAVFDDHSLRVPADELSWRSGELIGQ